MSASCHPQVLILSRHQMFLIFHITNFISFCFIIYLHNRTVPVEKKEKAKKWEQINCWFYLSNYSGTSVRNHVTDKSKPKFSQTWYVMEF